MHVRQSLTSSESQDVLDAQFLGLVQVTGDLRLGHATTRHVQHRLHAAVVQHRRGDRHGAGRLTPCRVARWVPSDVTE